MRTAGWPILTAILPLTLILFAAILLPTAYAGPPYITDDPEPVEYHHWEVYFASIFAKQSDAWTSTAPHLEVNYGPIPNVQLHIITPLSLYVPSQGPSGYGYGVTELGTKIRFVQESDWLPQIGIFPLLEVPTETKRNLGNGKLQMFLPMWLQKSVGKWTAYGGGGYWINPGSQNRNWWFNGIVIQYQAFSNLAPGLEIFHETSQEVGQSAATGLNLGMVWDLSDVQHILLSTGPAFGGPNQLQGYFAYQLNFGP